MSYELNGSNQYLSTPVSADFEFGTGDFTVSLNCRFVTISSSILQIISLGDGAIGGTSPTQCGWMIRYDTGLLNFYRYEHPVETYFTFSWSPSTATDYNIVVTRTGTSLKAVVDGGQIGTTITTSQNYNRVNSDNLNIGRGVFGFGSTWLNAQLSEIGIWKAGLTDNEIASLSKGFTPDQIRPQSLTFYLPLVRNVQDLRDAKSITNTNGATPATHPRVIQ